MPTEPIVQTTPDPVIPEDELFKSVIPAAYHDKPYMKELLAMKTGPEAYEAFCKKLDGAQTLIGKKTGIPADDAPAEEWNTFYGKLRPETAEAYEFKTVEGQTPDEEFLKAVRGVYHEAGLSKTQGGRVNEGILKVIEARQTAAKEAVAAQDAAFEVLTKATFGEDNKQVMENVQAALKEHTPENLKPFVDKLSNENMVIVAGVINAIQKKYIPEDKLNGKGGPLTTTNVIDLRSEGRRLMNLPAYKDTFHKDHASVVAQVADTYKKAGEKG